MKRLFFFFAFLFLCGNIVAQDNYITVENIAYRIPGDDYVDSMCRLDLNYLEDGKNLPVVVWFHGEVSPEVRRLYLPNFGGRDLL